MQEYDLVIVGAGLVGKCLISALHNQGFSIAVIEKQFSPAFSNTVERPITLSYASIEILRNLGLWQTLAPDARPIKEVQVSELHRFASLHFKADELGVSALGAVIPHSKLQLQLHEFLSQAQNLTLIQSEEILQINALDTKTIVEIKVNGQVKKIATQLLIGCDGASSTVRDRLQIPVEKIEGDKVALTATLNLQTPYPPIAMERFGRKEVLAILPLFQEKQCGLVWSLPKEKSSQIQAWPAQQWIESIQTFFRGRLPKIQSIIFHAEIPLRKIIPQTPFVPGALLLGDAAHTLFPLGAQGFNLAIRDVAACAEILVNAKRKHEPLGSRTTLQEYTDWRLQDQKRILQFTNTLDQGFSLSFPFSGMLRGLGLLFTELCPSVKKQLAQTAMGLTGKLPKLARGLPL